MNTTTSAAYKNQPFMATLYTNTARAAKAGCCPMCATPRKLETVAEKTYIVCPNPRCGDRVEVPGK